MIAFSFDFSVVTTENDGSERLLYSFELNKIQNPLAMSKPGSNLPRTYLVFTYPDSLTPPSHRDQPSPPGLVTPTSPQLKPLAEATIDPAAEKWTLVNPANSRQDRKIAYRCYVFACASKFEVSHSYSLLLLRVAFKLHKHNEHYHLPW